MTILEALRLAQTQSIKQLEAELIIAQIIAKPRTFVIAHEEIELSSKQEYNLRKMLTRRATGEPLAYILGVQEFFGRSFKVTPDTLIPRADTEILVTTALEILRKNPKYNCAQKTTVVDIGTGSGNIIISIVAEITQQASFNTSDASKQSKTSFDFYGIDIDADTLRVATTNATSHNVADSITFVQSDLLSALMPQFCANHQHPTSQIQPKTNLNQQPLLILANLPYVDSAHKTKLLTKPQSRELAFEPAKALWAHQGGLALYDQLFAQITQIAQNSPNQPITILCEIDPSQETPITKLAKNHLSKTNPNLSTTTKKDLQNHLRIIQIELL